MIWAPVLIAVLSAPTLAASVPVNTVAVAGQDSPDSAPDEDSTLDYFDEGVGDAPPPPAALDDEGDFGEAGEPADDSTDLDQPIREYDDGSAATDDAPRGAYDSNPAPAATRPRAIPPGYEPAGMDDIVAGLLMFGGGILSAFVLAIPIAIVGVVTLGIGFLFVPALFAGIQVFIGDTFSKRRGVLLWPILTAYAAGVVGAAAGVGVAFGASLLRGALPGIPGIDIAGQAVGALVGIAFASLPIIVYFLTAEDKRPGDSGGGMPGFVEPAHPVRLEMSLAPSKRSRRNAVAAMAF